MMIYSQNMKAEKTKTTSKGKIKKQRQARKVKQAGKVCKPLKRIVVIALLGETEEELNEKLEKIVREITIEGVVSDDGLGNKGYSFSITDL
jgi:hypothetical protein